MNDNQNQPHLNRNQTLILVEGEHEKDIMLNIMLKCFPEIPIDLNNVHIYGSDIYDLFHAIEKEYEEDWYKNDLEIDLPFIISKRHNISPKLDKRKFTNIILIFDYERHDNFFLEDKIRIMQSHFNNVTDDGMLYINYPMIEAYQHFLFIPDNKFIDRNISVSCRPGSKYKNLVKKDSIVLQYLNFYEKIEKQLYGKIKADENKISDVFNKILSISNKENLDEEIGAAFSGLTSDEKIINNSINYLKSLIINQDYLDNNMSFWSKLREIVIYILKQNIAKSYKLQSDSLNSTMTYKELYYELDMEKILEIQNTASKDETDGIIWVLCTCIMFLCEYKYFLKIIDVSICGNLYFDEKNMY